MNTQGIYDGQDLDDVLLNWAYVPGKVGARLLQTSDGRHVLQVRIDLGVVQMEVKCRPDGTKPFGFKTYLAYLKHLLARSKGKFVPTPEQLEEAMRELKQYQSRRMGWLALRRYSPLVRDADHSLAMINFLQAYCDVREMRDELERDRSWVLYHRTQASTMIALKENGPDQALEEVDTGIRRQEVIFATLQSRKKGQEGKGTFEKEVEKMLRHLHEIRRGILEHYQRQCSLEEQLRLAIRREDFELAAELRNRIHEKINEESENRETRTISLENDTVWK